MAATILEILNTILPVFLVAGTGFVLSRLVLDRIALILAIIVFIGFASIPLAALTGILEPITPLAATH